MIGLAEAIKQLRRELGEAQDEGADQQLRFEVDEVQLELLVELHKDDTGPGASVRFGVVSFGTGSGTASRGHAHRVTLTLKVKDEALGGSTAEVTDQERRDFSR
jgi:hypothetical protein